MYVLFANHKYASGRLFYFLYVNKCMNYSLYAFTVNERKSRILNENEIAIVLCFELIEKTYKQENVFCKADFEQ